MFAVPGWSVSASQLKLQRESTSKEKTAKADDNGQSTVEGKKSKKRKRGHGKINGAEVTNDNFADLWQKHIEGRNLPQKSEDENPLRKRKRVRKQKTNELLDAGEEKHAWEAQDGENSFKQLPPTTNDLEKRTLAPTNTTAAPLNRKTKKKQRKTKGHEQPQPKDSEASHPLRPSTTESASKPAATTPTASLPPPPPLPSNAKLTPLQTAMRAKLISARFRHLNQTLYTTPSTHASTLFSSNPEAFASYHAGFRSQVASWPSNPVEIFIEEIKSRGASGGPRSQKQLWRTEKRKQGGKKGKPNADPKSGVSEAPKENAAEFTKIDPLPRHFQAKICTIIDLGCGEAHLHASLLPLTGSLNLKLQSFDLAPGAGPNAHLITVSDIARLPLADGSADVAIFCLALMGTNWIDFVVEAARVVRVGGECWVGEVRSRFAGAKDIEKLKGEKGRKGNKAGRKEKRKKRGNDEDDDEELKKVGAPIQVEEEEISAASGKQAKPKEQETDVGPFLEVFRRRGFVLKGEVDLGNKMFVRMKFARVRDHGAGGPKRQDGPKVAERDDGGDLDPEVEAQVLKPCVYKTR
ncbi:MAG: hypothetical protein LQ339_005341 [Xanthoria mediterranea]|nr:MAG: hypothetical protein LQ339_005341 [Xanthoria mediterranea]